jgi:hypothetical protein
MTIRNMTAELVAWAVWQLPDNSIIETPISQAQYENLAVLEAQIRPAPDAVFLMAAGGIPGLDTSDGYAHAGDAWEIYDYDLKQTVLKVAVSDGWEWGYTRSVKSEIDLTTAKLTGFEVASNAVQTFTSYDVKDLDSLRVRQAKAPTFATIDKIIPDHHSITFDAASAGVATSAASITVSHVVGTGTNKHLFSGLSWSTTSETPVSCVYNTTETMTDLGGSRVNRGLNLYSLVNPSTATANIVGTKSAATGVIRLSNTSRFGVNQTTPTRTRYAAQHTGTAPSITVVDSQATDMVVDVAVDAGSLPITADASQTARVLFGTPAGGLNTGSSEELATGANTVMSWSSGGVSTNYELGAVALVDAASVKDMIQMGFIPTLR